MAGYRKRPGLPTKEEFTFYENTSKAQLYEMLKQFAERLVDPEDEDNPLATSFDVIQNEKRVLKLNGII